MPTTEPDNIMADLQSVAAKLRDAPADPDGGEQEAPSALTEAPTEAAPETPGTDAKPSPERVRREDGTFAPKPKEAKAPEVTAKPKLAAVPKPAEAPDAAPAPLPAVTHKAPASWRPEVREKWAALPPDVQAEIIRREREASTGLGQAAPWRQKAETWEKTIAPFAMMFQADGIAPERKVAGLLQLEAALRTGAPAAKAGIVANIVRQFGVTVEDLATALDGKPAQGAAAPPPDYRDPRVDQLFGALRQRAQQVQAQQSQEAEVALAKVKDSEFYEDLREDAADFLEAAAKRGRAITVERAFELAAQAHPEVSKVQAQRKAAEDSKAKQAEALKKRAAASSIRSLPGAPATEDADTDGSLRGDLEAVAKRLASR